MSQAKQTMSEKLALFQTLLKWYLENQLANDHQRAQQADPAQTIEQTFIENFGQSKLYWKLIVESAPHVAPNIHGPQINCQKELSFWGRLKLDAFGTSEINQFYDKHRGPDSPKLSERQINDYMEALRTKWHRFLFVSRPLPFETVGYVNNAAESIQFKQGGLIISDEGVLADLKALGFAAKENLISDTAKSTAVAEVTKSILRSDLYSGEVIPDYDNIPGVSGINTIDQIISEVIPPLSYVRPSLVDIIDKLFSYGRNIYIEAEVSIIEELNRLSVPVFTMPQPDNRSIKLEEIWDRADLTNKAIHWSISGQTFTPKNHIAVNGMHLITVNQDQDKAADVVDNLADILDLDQLIQNQAIPSQTANDLRQFIADTKVRLGKTYFDAIVDTMPLIMTNQNDSEYSEEDQFLFYLGPNKIYIGFDPSQPARFTGDLKRLVFDPNAFCPSCFS